MTLEPAAGSGLHVKAGTAASWGPQYTFDDVSMPTDYGLAGGAGMRLGGYSGGASQGDTWTREVYRNGELIEAGRWNGSVSTGAAVDVNPESGTTTYAVRESQIEVREVQPLAAPFAAGRIPDALAQAREDSQTYYRDIQDSADANGRPDLYIGAKFGSLAADVGYDFAEAGRGIYRLATDANARASAAEQLKFLATHPEVLVDGAIEATRTFINKPFDQQADSVFKGGLSLLAGAGGAKLGSAAGGLTLQGVERSAQWLGSTADNMLFSYMDRMGLVLRAAPEGPSLAFPRLSGDARVLAANMGGIPEGYQAHHLGMSSILRDSPAFSSLAERGLYDINRASNGLALPGDAYLALADNKPLHYGFHGPEYRLAVQNAVDHIDKAHALGASDDALLNRIARMEQSLASRLLSGDLWLNNADAAIRKLGPYK